MYHEKFKNSRPRVQFYRFLLKKSVGVLKNYAKFIELFLIKLKFNLEHPFHKTPSDGYSLKMCTDKKFKKTNLKQPPEASY